LYGRPGRKLFVPLPKSPLRCLWGGDNRGFAVAGDSLYEFAINTTDINGAAITGKVLTDYGFVGLPNPPTQPAQIFSNQNQLFVVSNGQGYLLDGSKGPGPIPVVAAAYGAYLDGYFIAQQPGNASLGIPSNQFNLSGLLDGSMWDPLDFATKQGSPDALSAIYADHEELWLLGQKTTEVWYDSGAANFPLQRIQGAFIEQGCWAPYSVAAGDNTIFWLGGSVRGVGIVWRAVGYTPTRVSNHAIETAIAEYWYKYGDIGIDNAVGRCEEDRGHTFYRLDFPTPGKTWLYDIGESAAAGVAEWHERDYRAPATNLFSADKARFHCQVFGHHLVGDYTSGNIYIQDMALLDDDGDPIRRLRSAPHLTNERQWTFYPEFVLALATGGNPDLLEPFLEGGGNPIGYLRTSDDGGQTWSNEIELGFGELGQYGLWVVARQLGRSRNRVFEVSSTASIQHTWLQAYIKIKAGVGGPA
jgi:hypothetical protein